MDQVGAGGAERYEQLLYSRLCCQVVFIVFIATYAYGCNRNVTNSFKSPVYYLTDILKLGFKKKNQKPHIKMDLLVESFIIKKVIPFEPSMFLK